MGPPPDAAHRGGRVPHRLRVAPLGAFGPVGTTISDCGEEGFDLEGDADSLRALAFAVESSAMIVVGSGRATGSIVVHRSGDTLAIAHKGSHVVISGSQRSLKLLASALRNVAAGPRTPSPVRFHAHIEYYPDHPWLGPESDAVAVYLLR
jgi:hypothetical protein